jgi:hypothetical protein
MPRKRASEIYPGQQKREKQQLWRRTGPAPLERAAKRKFFELFGFKCFKCGTPEREVPLMNAHPILCIDHHVPMALGGHLIPGNLVALCRRCNELKLDRAPETLYSAEDLDRLQPLLDCQAEFFKSVHFNFDLWLADPEGYLVGVGYSPREANEMLYDESHPDWYYVGRSDSKVPSLTITFDIDGNVNSVKRED